MTAAASKVTVEPVVHPTLLGLRIRRRAVLVGCALLAVVAAGSVASFTIDDSGIPLGRLVEVLSGGGTTREQNNIDTRVPQLLVALGVGMALAVSGSFFQSVTRNPLGSPDVIGLSSGSAAGVAALVWLAEDAPTWIGAAGGALAATALVRLGAGKGFRATHRLILTGIGVAAIATALVQYTVTRMGAAQSQNLTAWIYGTLSARSSGDATVIWVSLAVLLPLALLLTRDLEVAEMGDETAWGLGIAVGRVRASAILVAVALAAAAAAVAGPVAFVALTAPQIARRLSGSTGPSVVASALTGAALLTWANIAALHLPLFPRPLPVGVLTAGIGGVYLVALLTLELRKGSM